MIVDENASRHVLFVLVDADEYDRQGSIGLGAEVEPHSRAARLSEQLIDHFARKMSATIRQRGGAAAQRRDRLFVRDHVLAWYARIRHRVLREYAPALPRGARPDQWK